MKAPFLGNTIGFSQPFDITANPSRNSFIAASFGKNSFIPWIASLNLPSVKSFNIVEKASTSSGFEGSVFWAIVLIKISFCSNPKFLKFWISVWFGVCLSINLVNNFASSAMLSGLII